VIRGLLLIAVVVLILIALWYAVRARTRARAVRAGWRLHIETAEKYTRVYIRRGHQKIETARIRNSDPNYDDEMLEAEQRALDRAATMNSLASGP